MSYVRKESVSVLQFDNRELKQATFLTTRTLTGSKFDVFDQSRHLLQPLWRPCCQKRRLLKLSNDDVEHYIQLILSVFFQSSKPLKSWNSTPNLKSSCEENFPLRRYNSFHLVYPQLTLTTPPRLPAKERKVDSESLRFLLTTAPEEKPLHERMDTLRQSREWLLKELKSMREEDRRLARQFIHLRSAIVELREYCEKLELDYDSESDGSQKTNDTLHKDNKRSGLTERKIPIHNTPARNILNYCWNSCMILLKV